MNLKFVSEIFEAFNQSKTKKERVAILDEYSTHPTFPWVIDFIFNEKWEFNVTKPLPNYKPDDSPLGLSPSTLHEQMKSIYLLLKGHPQGEELTDEKRKNLLIQMCECIHPAEAEVLRSMVKKQSPVKFLTKALVEEVYPKMFGTSKQEETASV
tara:strand:- start:366 stop:827 length:462 start_codon:yes stop_codon:yes gene_type:complete